MPIAQEKWLITRTTLLGKLRDWEDESSWGLFFETYGPVIYAVAIKSGVSDADAQDIVQETIVAVARRMKEFQYDRSKGSFKSWLLTIARSKMVDRWRKTQRRPQAMEPVIGAEGETTFIHRLPDPAQVAPEELWEEEWKANLVAAAQMRLKNTANPRHYQIFDCVVNKGLEPATIAQKFGVKVEQVYVIKQRMIAALKEEVDGLKSEWTG
jgi:RNA polymerase sigma-70 factor (ECF subfamily)